MKTAVEFLQEALSIHLTFEQQMQFEGLFQQAKEIEYKKLYRAFIHGKLNAITSNDLDETRSFDWFYKNK